MEDFVHKFVELIVGGAATVLAPVLTGVVIKLFQKLRLNVDAARRKEIEDIVTKVLYEVEEWAAERVKAKLPVNSGQKLSRAVTQIVDKLPGISEAQAEALVRQMLPLLFLGAASKIRYPKVLPFDE